MPQFLFEGHRLDTERRELMRGSEQVALEPQVFDLIAYLVKNRDRVLTKGDLFAAVWSGRIVSNSTLTSRINSARKAVGDTGGEQRLIRTYARKGVRFIGEVHETTNRFPQNPKRKARPHLWPSRAVSRASQSFRLTISAVIPSRSTFRTA